MLTKKTVWIAAVMALASPSLAMAHPGHGTNSGWSAGLMHPLTGLDHLLVIAAIALLAVRIGGRARWSIPTAFIACGIAGGVAAWVTAASATAAMPAVELMIVASVLVCGVMLVRCESASATAIALIPLFGLFHGYAHIHELGAASQVGSYSLGIMAATAGLMVLTIGSGMLVQSLRSKDSFVALTRVAGGSLVVAAAAMFLGM